MATSSDVASLQRRQLEALVGDNRDLERRPQFHRGVASHRRFRGDRGDSDYGILRRGRPPIAEPLAPIAPYDSDSVRALSKEFDRASGKPVCPERLKTYAEVLAQYHLSCEGKFVNGRHPDRGRTERRHITASGVCWIGKEANKVGEVVKSTL